MLTYTKPSSQTWSWISWTL